MEKNTVKKLIFISIFILVASFARSQNLYHLFVTEPGMLIQQISSELPVITFSKWSNTCDVVPVICKIIRPDTTKIFIKLETYKGANRHKTFNHILLSEFQSLNQHINFIINQNDLPKNTTYFFGTTGGFYMSAIYEIKDKKMTLYLKIDLNDAESNEIKIESNEFEKIKTMLSDIIQKTETM